MKRVIFIASGGGHLSELLRLQPLFTKVDALIVSEQQAYDLDVPQRVVYLPRGTRNDKLRYAFIFPFICLRSLMYYVRFKPDVIVTTGAHTAVPMVYIASFFKKEVIFIESIARVRSKSLSGKLIEKRCTHILVQWESMCELYEKADYRGQIL
jgi:UDP-N-acetylglucosamine:LPS N-acetylglucosamine transferase